MSHKLSIDKNVLTYISKYDSRKNLSHLFVYIITEPQLYILDKITYDNPPFAKSQMTC